MTSGAPQHHAGGAVPTPSDAELLRAHVEGDSDAFAELVRRHRDRLWAVALRTIGDREEAADAVQDALLSAHRAAARFRGDSAVTTWLHRIVVNACLDRMRRRQAHPTVPLPEGGHGDDGRRNGPEPAAPASDHDTALVVREALAGLPVEQRAAIVLVDVQGYGVAEAAAILGVAEGTIKSRCARGRARMALTLGHLRPGVPGTGSRKPESPGNPDGSGSPKDQSHGNPDGSGSPEDQSHGDVDGSAGRKHDTHGNPDGAGIPQAEGHGEQDASGGRRDAGHGNPGGAGRVPSGSAVPSEGRDRP